MADKADAIITPAFRVAYSNVWEPRTNETTGQKSYSVCMIFSKSTDLTEMKDACRAFLRDKFGKDIPKGVKIPFRDGDKERDTKKRPEFKNSIFVNAKTKFRPDIIDRHKEPIVDEDDFYSGCYARASVNVYWFENKGNKGLSFGLRNLQKLRDGEKLSAGRDATQDFEEVDSMSSVGLEDDDELATYDEEDEDDPLGL